jgi:putative membrane protein insertion efficiency factor
MVVTVLIALIRLYQRTLSRLIVLTMGNVCRFEPSCSSYAAACLAGHGALRGSLLSLKRLCRCHPFHPGGYDPPPPPRESTRGHTNESIPAGPANPAALPGGAAKVSDEPGQAPDEVRVP